VLDAVAVVHTVVSEVIAVASSRSDEMNLLLTAGRFTDETRARLLADRRRRVLHEGGLTKYSQGGKGSGRQYRFFLFSDLLVYGKEGWTRSRNLVAHQIIPIHDAAVGSDPEPLIARGIPEGCGLRVRTQVKDLFLVASSAREAGEWSRRLQLAARERRRAMGVPPMEHELHEGGARSGRLLAGSAEAGSVAAPPQLPSLATNGDIDGIGAGDGNFGRS